MPPLDPILAPRVSLMKVKKTKTVKNSEDKKYRADTKGEHADAYP